MAIVLYIMVIVHLKDHIILLKEQTHKLFLENYVYVYAFSHNIVAKKLNNLNIFSVKIDRFKLYMISLDYI